MTVTQTIEKAGTPRLFSVHRIVRGVMNRFFRFKGIVDNFLGFRIQKSKASKTREAFAEGRFWYQSRFVKFDIPKGSKVLDIGSGPHPFKYATELCDLHPGETVHRRGDLVTHGLPITYADVHQMPYPDKHFDYVYTAHMLEHVEDPERACREIMRIGKRGFIETPNFTKDILFCQAVGMHHRWHTIAFENTLFFFEYSPREAEGARSSAWHEMIWSPYHHPLQDVFIENQDLFNTVFEWKDQFDVKVFRRTRK